MENSTTLSSVISKFVSREAAGINKYGTTVDRNDLNLDDWLNHLQEELMDATLYVSRVKSVCSGIRDMNPEEVDSLMETYGVNSLMVENVKDLCLAMIEKSINPK